MDSYVYNVQKILKIIVNKILFECQGINFSLYFFATNSLSPLHVFIFFFHFRNEF